MCTAGLCFYSGLGVKKDLATAAYWFSLAAEQNDAAAQYNLGNDHQLSARCWIAPMASLLVGVVYSSGRGVPEVDAAVVKWFSAAAVNNHIQAQFNLGMCGHPHVDFSTSTS